MTEPQAPLTPIDCDLRGLPFMPLDVVRLIDSDLFALSTGEEFKAAVALWCKSWNQVPAASLPADERVLASLAVTSLAEWRAASEMALHGWVPCSDGRLYHPVIAEKALAAWIERISHRKRSAMGNAKRYGHTFDPAPFDAAMTQSIDLLRVLSPNAAGAHARPADIVRGSDNAPSATVEGSLKEPARSEKTSEGRGTGTGTEEREAIASPSAGADCVGAGEVTTAVEAWNDLASRLGLPAAKSLEAARRKAIRARLARAGLSGWMQALDAVAHSRHCRGENDRNWRADIDFVAQPKSFARLIEGFYGRDAGAPSAAVPMPTWIAQKGEPFAISWLDPCGWRDLPDKAVITRSMTGRERLEREVGPVLRRLGVGIAIEPAREAA
jgi:hypothetical protein